MLDVCYYWGWAIEYFTVITSEAGYMNSRTKTKTWTIFGAGNMICDIIDAIESRGQKAKSVVLNMDLDRKVLDKIPASVEIVKLDEFQPAADYYFFGFVDPDKKPLLRRLQKYNLSFSNVIHKFSYIPRDVEMGQGNYISAGVVLATNIRIGNFNFINRGASIGHDTRIRHYNHFGPGCTIASGCIIGSRNCLYTSSAIIPKVQIKDDVILGAGGVVIADIIEPGTYVGVPARKSK
jgi:sugar O-acyltransferase (sialic acid O-acetyltransferase NeuD family)